MLLPGFARQMVDAGETRIHLAMAGSGPPLLLLHGYPQNLAMWHLVAPKLAADFTVVAADLRGYGDSGKPPSTPDHFSYSKRATAADMVAVMAGLGFDRFAVAGHDRGGRVAHRMALDHPARVSRAAVLDIVPTLKIFSTVDQAVATAYYHWFFLIQPFDLPERMIGADPEFYLRKKLLGWSSGFAGFHPEAVDDYVRCFRDPAVIHASCEDYRAAASIDLEHDRADGGRKVACPLLALWGEKGRMHRHYDVLATWRERAEDVRGRVLPCGHYLAEEEPEATWRELRAFFQADGRR
jgi:haloacetate dehalogenase